MPAPIRAQMSAMIRRHPSLRSWYSPITLSNSTSSCLSFSFGPPGQGQLHPHPANEHTLSEVPARLIKFLEEVTKEWYLDLRLQRHIILDCIQTTQHEVEDADLRMSAFRMAQPFCTYHAAKLALQLLNYSSKAPTRCIQESPAFPHPLTVPTASLRVLANVMNGMPPDFVGDHSPSFARVCKRSLQHRRRAHNGWCRWDDRCSNTSRDCSP